MHTRGTPRRCTECARVARRLLGLGICCPAVPAKPMAFFSHMGRAEPAPGRKTALELAAPSGGAGGAVALADVCPALTLTRAGAAVPGGSAVVLGVPAPPAQPVLPAALRPALLRGLATAPAAPLAALALAPWPEPPSDRSAGRTRSGQHGTVPPRGKDKSGHVAQAQGRPQTKAPPAHRRPQPRHPPVSPAWLPWGHQSAGRAGCGAGTSGRDRSHRFGTQPEREQGHSAGAV